MRTSMQICHNTLFKMSSFQQEKNDTYKKKQEIMTHVLEIKKKKRQKELLWVWPSIGLNTQILQNNNCKYVQRIKENHKEISKGRYDENVSSNWEYQLKL